MDIYLHFGVYKTGSSFLQSLCSINRSFLIEQGIYFPTSAREADMLAGRISPGNGKVLAELLKAGQDAQLEKTLRSWKTLAQGEKCNKLLISSEWLTHTFADQEQLQRLIELTEKVGIRQCFALGFVRAPVDHVLSTFKHRAKKGQIDDFQQWLRKEYQFTNVLQRFLTHFQETPIHWTFRRYEKNSEYLAQAFFVDWLKTTSPGIPKRESVNSSLTLSELSVIRLCREVIPSVNLQQAFNKLKPHEKAADKTLEKTYRQRIIQHLHADEVIYQELNRHLAADEQLDLIEPATETVDQSATTEITKEVAVALLSEPQLLAWMEAFHSSRTSVERFKKTAVRWNRFWRNLGR